MPQRRTACNLDRLRAIIYSPPPFRHDAEAPQVTKTLGFVERHGLSWAGKDVVVVGRGVTVGRAIGSLLTRREYNATVTLTHTGTTDLAAHLRRADVIVAAAGVPGIVSRRPTVATSGSPAAFACVSSSASISTAPASASARIDIGVVPAWLLAPVSVTT